MSQMPLSICEEARRAVDACFQADELDPELRGRLYIACTYFFLHLVHRHLELGLPEEESRELATMLLKETGRKGYHMFFSQDIVPKAIVEYFYTFFESNFVACSRYLGSYSLMVDKASGKNKKDVCTGFSSWLRASVDGCPEVDSMARLLWEAWTAREPFKRIRQLISHT